MEYIIRNARKDDFDNNLLNVFIDGYNLHQNNRPDKFPRRNAEELREILIETMSNEIFLVIEHENMIIGYVSYQIKEKNSKKFLWVDELVIDDNFQGKGLGKILIKKIEDLSREEECNSIEFCCWEFNRKAQDIYKHLDYKIQRVIFEKSL